VAVHILTIWHLWNIGQPDQAWEFSTNYKLTLEDRQLANRLQSETRLALESSELEPLREGVLLLVSEIVEITAGIETVGDGGFQLELTRKLDRLMRKPTVDGWGAHQIAAIGDCLEPNGRKYSEFSQRLELSNLSSLAKRTIIQLDLLAMDLSYAALRQAAASLSGAPPEIRNPDRRRRVFIAYRRSHSELAEWLFTELQSAGQGQHFRPYLDRHEMRPGDWQQQLVAAIHSADFFMPVASTDYGEPDTVSAFELELAQARAKDEDNPQFIVPVFVPGAGVVSDLPLSNLDGHVIQDVSELTSGDSGLHAWFARVASG